MVRAIIADDDRLFLESIVNHVSWQELGISVIATALDGTETIRLCRELKPELLLTDVRMPGKDGIESAKDILASAPDCHIIFMSAYASKKEYRSAIKLKAIDFLEKPLTLKELTESLRDAACSIQYKRKPLPTDISPKTRRVALYIQANYRSNLSVASLSELAEITPNYLSSIFKKEMGISLISFITKTRIDAACELLLNTNMVLKEICSEVGFPDVRHFSKVFRNIMNVSPGEYRRQK